jgi:nitric oxide reductase activation protein
MSEVTPADALARQVVVRYRGDGHVRFGLPAQLCEEPYAGAFEENLRTLAGVYRVTLYRRQGKLSIFYDRHAISLNDVARCLYATLAAPAAQMQRAATVAAVAQKLHVAKPLQWLKDKREGAKAKYAELKTKAQLLSRFAALQIHNQPVLKEVFTEKAAINFVNDIVVFYLIKVHWDMITQKWLKHPIRYRNAWLSTFYLVFLLVRYRKQPPKK